MKMILAAVLFIVTSSAAFAAPITTGFMGVDASGFQNLSTALTSPGTAGRNVIVSKVMTINNKTVGGKRRITVVPGGRIRVAAGKELSFGPDSAFESGTYRAFDGDGDVTGLKEVSPDNFVENVKPGTTDMSRGFVKALAASSTIKLTSATYGISRPITHLTSDRLATVPVANGIQILGTGVSGTIIQALPGFPKHKPLINLDGNKNEVQEPSKAVAQNFDVIKNLTLNCNNIAGHGIRLRAVANSTFEDLLIKGVAGGSKGAAIVIEGVTAPTKDDADCSFRCRFTRVTIRNSSGYGVLCVSSRCSSMVFEDCDIRSCAYDGMRISFANLMLTSVTFAGNGSAASASTGGFSAVRPATGAVNRGLVMNGCQFEANWNHEINIEWCHGFAIAGGLLTPYVKATANQALIKLGTGEPHQSEVEGGSIRGIRVAAYSSTGPVIAGVVVGRFARNIAFDSLSFDTSGSVWNGIAKQFDISKNAAAVTNNGKDVSAFTATVRFFAGAVLAKTPVPNVTGDGTEYLFSDLATTTTTKAPQNSGPQKISHQIKLASISGSVLSVTKISGAPLQVGNRITGKGIATNTFITELLSTSGGKGTYAVSVSQEVAPTSMTALDSQWYTRAKGIFTAPHTGSFSFDTRWPCTGFSGSETDVEVAIIVNPGDSSARHIVDKQKVSNLSGKAVEVFGGEKTVFLNAGDTVTSSIRISGGPKVVDLYRNFKAQSDLSFAGRAL